MNSPLKTRTRKTLLALSLAIAGASLAGCNNDATDDTAAADMTTPADDTADTMPPAYDDTAMTGTGMEDDMVTTGPITDQQFYQQAMTTNQKEIAAGNMALQQAEDQAVKDYAQMLVDDHTAMNQMVADQAGMADAATPAADPAATAELQGKTGADFDRAYIDMVVAGHEKAIAMVENAAKNASTEEARTQASNALPKLREHLQRAQELQSELGGGTMPESTTDDTTGADDTANP